jgi:hypothetical protein
MQNSRDRIRSKTSDFGYCTACISGCRDEVAFLRSLRCGSVVNSCELFHINVRNAFRYWWVTRFDHLAPKRFQTKTAILTAGSCVRSLRQLNEVYTHFDIGSIRGIWYGCTVRGQSINESDLAAPRSNPIPVSERCIPLVFLYTDAPTIRYSD